MSGDGSMYRERWESARAIYWEDTHQEQSYDAPYSCTSMICNQDLWERPFFQYWAEKVAPNLRDILASTHQGTEYGRMKKMIYHRKLWEFVYIAQALYERHMLEPYRRGIGFGVGTECLPDLFASYGCDILATDLAAESAAAKGWIETGQNAGGSLASLHHYHLSTDAEFSARVRYRPVDMNLIPSDLRGFDFAWSACALEHLGSLQKGAAFIRSSLDCVHSGGVVVHTTEYNLYSDDETIETAELSIYRRHDIEQLVRELETEGHYVWPVDFHVGEGVADKFIDLPPYCQKNTHLRLSLYGYPCTSIGLIIRKA